MLYTLLNSLNKKSKITQVIVNHTKKEIVEILEKFAWKKVNLPTSSTKTAIKAALFKFDDKYLTSFYKNGETRFNFIFLGAEAYSDKLLLVIV